MWYKNSWPELFELTPRAAGQAVVFRIPGETFVALSHASVTLTASAVVANRYVTLDILDGDSTITFRSMSAAALAATETRRYSFAPNVSNVVASAGQSELLPFPDSLLAPGMSLRFTAVGLDVGDQFNGTFLHLWRAASGMSAPASGATPFTAP